MPTTPPPTTTSTATTIAIATATTAATTTTATTAATAATTTTATTAATITAATTATTTAAATTISASATSASTSAGSEGKRSLSASASSSSDTNAHLALHCLHAGCKETFHDSSNLRMHTLQFSPAMSLEFYSMSKSIVFLCQSITGWDNKTPSEKKMILKETGRLNSRFTAEIESFKSVENLIYRSLSTNGSNGKASTNGGVIAGLPQKKSKEKARTLANSNNDTADSSSAPAAKKFKIDPSEVGVSADVDGPGLFHGTVEGGQLLSTADLGFLDLPPVHSRSSSGQHFDDIFELFDGDDLWDMHKCATVHPSEAMYAAGGASAAAAAAAGLTSNANEDSMNQHVADQCVHKCNHHQFENLFDPRKFEFSK